MTRPGSATCARPTPEPVDLWNPAELAYDGAFTAGGVTLPLHRHDGGDLDWYAVDADGPLPPPATPADPVEVTPGRLVYPGARCRGGGRSRTRRSTSVDTHPTGRTSPRHCAEPPAALDASGRPGFAYRPMTRIPLHWHPYVVETVEGRRRFVQGRAADLSGAAVVLPPPPASDLLIDPASGGVHPFHQLEPAAVPADGVRVERRAMLARDTSGAPVL